MSTITCISLSKQDLVEVTLRFANLMCLENPVISSVRLRLQSQTHSIKVLLWSCSNEFGLKSSTRYVKSLPSGLPYEDHEIEMFCYDLHQTIHSMGSILLGIDFSLRRLVDRLPLLLPGESQNNVK